LARSWLRDRTELDSHLKAFSVDRAECWCCKVNHVHPDTGAKVSCDRQLIYEAIDTWFPGGRADFERDTRLWLGRNVDKKMSGMFRFRDALYITLPSLWLEISKLGADCPTLEHVGGRGLWVFGICLSWFPLSLGITMLLCAVVYKRRQRCDWCVTFVTSLICTVASAILSQIYLVAGTYAWYVSLAVSLLGMLLAKVLLDNSMIATCLSRSRMIDEANSRSTTPTATPRDATNTITATSHIEHPFDT